MTVRIYHNPRCSKSRKTLELLEKKGVDIEIYQYLDQGISHSQVLELSKVLDKNVIDFVRTKEAEFKDFDIDWNDNDKAAMALEKTPKLLERPIVVHGEKAVIGRPPENIENLF